MNIIIDGSSVAYRTWYGRDVKGFDGIPDQPEEVNEVASIFVRSFCKYLVEIVKLIDLTRPESTHVWICWDGISSTQLRRELYPEYKKNRKARKDKDFGDHINVYTFIEILRHEFRKINPNFDLYSTYAEADDLIAILCDLFASDQNTIVTEDKDMYQLINNKTKVLHHLSGKWIDEQAVFSDFGVYPSDVVPFKTLTGDSSDNYPGIKGIGPKKASRILAGLSPLPKNLDNDAVAVFRKIATIPFEGFDATPFLTNFIVGGQDTNNNWDDFAQRYNFNIMESENLNFIV